MTGFPSFSISTCITFTEKRNHRSEIEPREQLPQGGLISKSHLAWEESHILTCISKGQKLLSYCWVT